MTLTHIAILIGLLVIGAIIWQAIKNDDLAGLPHEHLMRESAIAMEQGEIDNKYSRELARRADPREL